jgi:(p)ppGpp synthase/HD superfamily hydrolase
MESKSFENMGSVRNGIHMDIWEEIPLGFTSLENLEGILAKKIERLEKNKNDNLKTYNTFNLGLNVVKNMHFIIDNNERLSVDEKKKYEEKLFEAFGLTNKLHHDQKPRPDGPYLNHIFRVTNRIVEEYGIKDPELVIAALLHDSVEDQAKKLAELFASVETISEREKALLFVKNNFGERVSKIVSKLSNPEPETEGLSSDQKNYVYKEHVKEAIEDSDVLPIKLSDFSDNALNLKSVSDPVRRLKLSKKYLPVMEVFIERLKSAQNILSEEKIAEITSRLMSAIEDTRNFIETQKSI